MYVCMHHYFSLPTHLKFASYTPDKHMFFVAIGELFRYETKGLRLLAPQRSDTGTYRCLASVTSQSSVSASAVIIVEGNDN